MKPLLSIPNTPGMPEAIAAVVAESRNKVCALCGLGQMGHAPESSWLGFEKHS